MFPRAYGLYLTIVHALLTCQQSEILPQAFSSSSRNGKGAARNGASVPACRRLLHPRSGESLWQGDSKGLGASTEIKPRSRPRKASRKRLLLYARSRSPNFIAGRLVPALVALRSSPKSLSGANRDLRNPMDSDRYEGERSCSSLFKAQSTIRDALNPIVICNLHYSCRPISS